MVKLSKRLKTIHDMVPYSVTCDVGADHGKLIISLYEDGIIPHGYAVENKKGPYQRLVKEIENHNLLDYITPMFSDGITDLTSDVETLILAGMGGQNIIDILTSHREKLKNIKTIIVDAHSLIPKMREEICNLGFNIADEKILKEDDIYYEIIKFIKSDIAFYSENDLEFGPILRQEKSITFKEKYESRIKEIDNLLSKGNLPLKRVSELTLEKEKIRGIL